MMPLDKLTGRMFGRLLVLDAYTLNPTKWLCRCSCGTEQYVRASTMKAGVSKSCGCLQKELARTAHTTHGMKKSAEWKTWQSIKRRCSPLSKDAPNYANRGITVCARWEKFENFFADMGIKPHGTSIERKDNNKGYTPENCIWATSIEQGRNTRVNKLLTFQGTTQTQSAWAAYFGVDDTLIMRRLKSGWTVEDALTAPPNRRVRHKPRESE